MRIEKWTIIAAAVTTGFPALLWAIAIGVHSRACPAWCLTCTHACGIGEADIGWLMVWGLIVSPYVLLVTVPLCIVLIALAALRRRREA